MLSFGESPVLPDARTSPRLPRDPLIWLLHKFSMVFNFFPFFFPFLPCYLNGFKHETRPGKGDSIVLIISNYDRCNINCIFP